MEEIETVEVIKTVLHITDFLLLVGSIVLQEPRSELGLWNFTEWEECEDNHDVWWKSLGTDTWFAIFLSPISSILEIMKALSQLRAVNENDVSPRRPPTGCALWA